MLRRVESYGPENLANYNALTFTQYYFTLSKIGVETIKSAKVFSYAYSQNSSLLFTILTLLL